MTGFGVAQGAVRKGKYRVEIKSVNHRFCEVNVRIPPRLSVYDSDLQNLIRNTFTRGRIDVFIREESNGLGSETRLDIQKMQTFLNQVNQAKKKLKLKGEITIMDLMLQKDCCTIEVADDSALVWKAMQSLLKNAITKLQVMREKEGESIRKWLQTRLKVLEDRICSVEKIAKQFPDRYRERLQERVNTLQIDKSISADRLATEVALIADRSDVTEEIVRFKSHLEQFHFLIGSSNPVGRKLDFLLQEMAREINTIGSKAQDIKITNEIIEIKSDVEKIREQVQNVE